MKYNGEITEDYIHTLESKKERYQIQVVLLEKDISDLQSTIRLLEKTNTALEQRLQQLEVTQ